MRPLGLGPRDVLSLARGARPDATTVGPIVVSGVEASAVAAALGEGADAGAVVVRSDPAGAAAIVRVLDSETGAADREVLRAGARASVPLIALVRDPAVTSVPYVRATDVVSWPRQGEVPVGQLARVIASSLGSDAGEVAARVPALRDAARRTEIVGATATAAALALLRGKAGPLAPVLALRQARMLRTIARTRGDAPPSEPQAVAATVGPELAAAVVTGLLARGLVRRLPVRNRLLEAGVAAAGTFALASLAEPLSHVVRSVNARLADTP